MARNLLRSLRQAIAKLHPSGSKTKTHSEDTSLGEKLHDLKWMEDEDDAALGETLAASSNESGATSNLAAAVYTGRPQNPFSEGS